MVHIIALGHTEFTTGPRLTCWKYESSCWVYQ